MKTGKLLDEFVSGIWFLAKASILILGFIHLAELLAPPKAKTSRPEKSLLFMPKIDMSPKVDPMAIKVAKQESIENLNRAIEKANKAINSPEFQKRIKLATDAYHKPIPLPISLEECQKWADGLNLDTENVIAPARCEAVNQGRN
ncbi:MAG: hypothetical protein AABZ55_06575 [Bdellovibrionota bacterium]